MKAAPGSGLISLTARRLRRFWRRRPYAAREAALIGIELCEAFSAVHAEGLLQGTSGDFGGTGTAFAWASKVEFFNIVLRSPGRAARRACDPTYVAVSVARS